MASNDWLIAILEARSIPNRTNPKLYDQNLLNKSPNVYASLAVVSPEEIIPQDGRCTRRPFGMLIGYDQYLSGQNNAEKFPLIDGSIIWNTAVAVRKAITLGSRAVITLWDKDAKRPESAGGGIEDVMLGKVIINLPPSDQVQWYTLKTYDGIASVDAKDSEKPLFSVKIEITRPGQTLSLYAETSIRSTDKDMKLLRRPPLLYSESTGYDDIDKRIGYTSGNIREYIQVEDTKEIDQELLLGHDINHELLRMAEDEELMQAQNPFVDAPRNSAGLNLHPALHAPKHDTMMVPNLVPNTGTIMVPNIQNTPFLQPQTPALFSQAAPIPTTLRYTQPAPIQQAPFISSSATPLMAPMAEPHLVPGTPSFAPQYDFAGQQYGNRFPTYGY